MRVKEEGQPRREVVHIEALPFRPFHILDAVVQREGEFLKRGRAGYADVIAADGNRVPVGNVLGAELECIDD